MASNNSLYNRIRHIINKNDPMGLFPSAPSDEYHPEIREIMTYINSIKSSDEFSQMVYKTFLKWFSPVNVGTITTYQKIAREIWSDKEKQFS